MDNLVMLHVSWSRCRRFGGGEPDLVEQYPAIHGFSRSIVGR